MAMRKPCRDESHEGENPLPLSEFYKTPSGQFGRSAYCKVCHRRRASISVARYRERNLKLGLRKHATVMERNDALNAAASRHKDGYLARHEQRREREREIEASFLRDEGEQPNAGEMSLDRYSFKGITSQILFGRSPQRFKRAWSA
jgi:hypothetical protein